MSGSEPSAGDGGHIPVLLDEVLERLSPRPGQVFVDGTVGLGGHAASFAEAVAPSGSVIALDRDAAALEIARNRLRDAPVPIRFVHAPFSQIRDSLRQLGIPPVDGILVDLGVSSMQLDHPERGFSFRDEGPLDMRMDPSGGRTAADLLHELSAEEIADILWKYGEERFSRRIAKSVVEARSKKTIDTTGALAAIVRRCVPGRSRIDKATRTFQALRIAVNDELGELERLLDVVPEVLAPGGRVAVISFHSLEDRLVKYRFRDWKDEERFRILTRKPVVASGTERKANPRSRSAKLRVAERLADE